MYKTQLERKAYLRAIFTLAQHNLFLNYQLKFSLML